MLPGLQDTLLAALADRYRLLTEVGRGGMAVVYSAEDLKHQRRVALKVMRPEVLGTSGRERFEREIAIAAHLAHPHILPLHDSGEAAGHLFFVMPFVEGESLRARLLREGPLPVADAVRLAEQVASALGYAHGQGVVHRDIKPENILIESGDEVFVTDFGLARAIEGVGLPITESGLVLGTPAYMSPEQVEGRSKVDGRSDIYALGCVLYEMLAGEPPFSGQTAQLILTRQLCDQPTPLGVLRPGVPPWLEALVTRMLAKVPADRPPTASVVAHALAMGSSGATTPLPRVTQRRQSQRLAFAAGIAAVGLVVAGGLAIIARRAPHLDAHRIVVFAPEAEDVGTAMLAAIGSTELASAIDGDAALPATSGAAQPTAMREVARRSGAGNWVLVRPLRGDSLHLVLEHHLMPGDSVRRHVLAFASGADSWVVGLASARMLVADLLGPTRAAAGLAQLQDRAPDALAWYFMGERSYRNAEFGPALEQFDRAIALDSTFTYAALRGAQAASWTERAGDAERLMQLPMARLAELTPRQAAFARGLDAYLHGRADSAVTWFRESVRLDAGAVEGWMGIGETYTHLLPGDGPLDSLAEAAFLRARRLDSAFAPALPHLVEFAARRGDAATARARLTAFAAMRRDTSTVDHLVLMLRCAVGAPIDWRREAARSPQRTVAAAQLLSAGGLQQPRCALAAWEALQAEDTIARHRFGILAARQAVLLAVGQHEAARRLIEGDTLFNVDLRNVMLTLGALAGAPFDPAADAFSDSVLTWLRTSPSDIGGMHLYAAGNWLARRGRVDDAATLAADLARRAATEGGRADSLRWRSVSARLTLARGDTAAAIAQLQALHATGNKAAIQWSPWESLGGERLLLAQLLLATRNTEAALRVARSLDAPARLLDVVYVPASLRLRVSAADSWGDQATARAARARLTALGALR